MDDDYGVNDNVTQTNDDQNKSFTSKALEKLEEVMRIVTADQMFYTQALRDMGKTADSVHNLALPAYNKAVDLLAKASGGTAVSDSDVMAVAKGLEEGSKLSSDAFVAQAGPNFDINKKVEVHGTVNTPFYNPNDVIMPDTSQSYANTHAKSATDIYDLVHERSAQNTGGMPGSSGSGIPAPTAGRLNERNADAVERSEATSATRNGTLPGTHEEVEDRLGRWPIASTPSSQAEIRNEAEGRGVATSPILSPTRPTINSAERAWGDAGQRANSPTTRIYGVADRLAHATTNTVPNLNEVSRITTPADRIQTTTEAENQTQTNPIATVSNGIVRGEDLSHQAVAAAKTVLIGDQDGDGVLSAGENTALASFYQAMGDPQVAKAFTEQVAKQAEIDSETHRDIAKAAESADTLQQVKLDQIDSYDVSDKIKDQAKNAVLGGNTSSASALIDWFKGAAAPAGGGAVSQSSSPSVPPTVPAFTPDKVVAPKATIGSNNYM